MDTGKGEIRAGAPPAAAFAVWGMQFIRPIGAEYRIIHLAPDDSRPASAASSGIMSGSRRFQPAME
jgi:hypothetical protein